MKYIYSEETLEKIAQCQKALDAHDKSLFKRLNIDPSKFDSCPKETKELFRLDTARLGLAAQQARFIAMQTPIGFED
jgi:hypothetical protein